MVLYCVMLIMNFLFPLQPMVDNKYGTRNNVVEVKESDFNFLNALEQDMANSKHKSDSTGASSDVSYLSPHHAFSEYINAITLLGVQMKS